MKYKGGISLSNTISNNIDMVLSQNFYTNKNIILIKNDKKIKFFSKNHSNITLKFG